MLRVPSYIVWPIVVACAYGVLSLVANRAAFHPSRYPQGFWDLQSQVGASDVWLNTPDGVRLHAWWVHRENTRLVTLFLHGNAGNVTDRIPHIREIVAAGSSILIPRLSRLWKERRPTDREGALHRQRNGARVFARARLSAEADYPAWRIARNSRRNRLGGPSSLRRVDSRSPVHFRERRGGHSSAGSRAATGSKSQFCSKDPLDSEAEAVHARRP